MTEAANRLKGELMTLSPEDRAELVHIRLGSLDEEQLVART
jgi:hypothetical protein